MSVTPSPIAGFAGQFFDNNGIILSGGKIFTYAAGTTTPQASYTSASGTTPHANPIILDSAGRVPGGEIWLTDGLVYKFVIETSTNVLIGTYDNITGVNSNFINYTVQEEVITATAGQTVFNLTTITYTPGTNSLSVYIDGVNQYVGDSYLETDSDTVTFTAGLHVGAEVKFTTAIQTTTGSVDASIVSYDPPFTGSVATNVEDKLAQYISVKDFGAVGDGVADDTAAIQAAITAIETDLALNPALMPSINYEIGQNLTKLVPVTLTGGAGMYKVTQPIVFRRVKGLKVSSLNLIADSSFVGDYLVVVGDTGAFVGVENFTYENSLLNANFVCGGVKFTDTVRCLLFNNEILGFNTNGVYITGGHPPSVANYETIVDNCYIGVVPAGGTVPGTVVLDNTTAIFIERTDNVIRDNQLFKQGVGIKILPAGGNDIIQGNHIYSSSVSPMDVDSYPNVITGNYFDDLALYLRQPYFTVVSDNYFFANTNLATDFFIAIAPKQPNQFFQRLTIADNSFLNIGTAKCESIVVDSTNGTIDFSNTRNVDISGNTFNNVKFMGSKIRQTVTLNAVDQYTFNVANTQFYGNVGQLQYSLYQQIPDPFVPGGGTDIVTSCISGIGGQQAVIKFSKTVSGTLYVECDINTLSDNTI
jgi:hypothetical protein